MSADAAAERRSLANPTARAGIPVVHPEIKVRQLFHHAFRARDSAATRHFYEDLLGMPLVASFVETRVPSTGAPTNYIHTYFGLGDGAALAFFMAEARLTARATLDNWLAGAREGSNRWRGHGS